MSPGFVLTAGAAYVLLCRNLLRLPGRARDPLFALLNVVVVFYFFFWPGGNQHAVLYGLAWVLYLGVVALQYGALRLWADGTPKQAWTAFLVPIAALLFSRYAPLVPLVHALNQPTGELLRRHPELGLSRVFVGLSYLTFRSSYLVLEVRNGVVPRPNFWQYVGFVFFAPTLSVGPINRYSEHQRAFRPGEQPPIPIQTAFLRMLVGAVKYQFLGPILNQFTYTGLMLDGHPHQWCDLPIAAVAYYGYIYCNFSGFCDMAIGAAGLIGISVAENFANPFGARNSKEFWNRWHMTLSLYMRDVLFSPLSRALVRLFGGSHVNHAIAVTIFVVFVLIGIWHGIGWHFAAFGVSQAMAVVANHYYTLQLKKWLGRDRFAAYNRSPLIRALAVTTTFAFTSASLFLFANDGSAMEAIFRTMSSR
jgi:D-alanyl-lipoteichoic acid acyltransferase DltB (MBOAT superfamily)